MIDLSLFCAALTKRKSRFRHEASAAAAYIYSILRSPSLPTRKYIEGWRGDFAYLYGDMKTNLSGNSKLDKRQILEKYGIDAEEDGETEAVELLFFAIQTYFSLLLKCITREILQEVRAEDGVSYEELISGDFAKRYGITNYGGGDWYDWPLYERENGFDKVPAGIRQMLAGYTLKSGRSSSAEWLHLNSSHDFIKQIYEAVIPKELRHALGEYYTPDWLAERTLSDAVNACECRDIRALSITDEAVA